MVVIQWKKCTSWQKYYAMILWYWYLVWWYTHMIGMVAANLRKSTMLVYRRFGIILSIKTYNLSSNGKDSTAPSSSSSHRVVGDYRRSRLALKAKEAVGYPTVHTSSRLVRAPSNPHSAYDRPKACCCQRHTKREGFNRRRNPSRILLIRANHQPHHG